MSEARDILDAARRRAAERDAARPRIDYDRMNRIGPKQKAALTRAKNSGDPEKVVLACRNAVREWDEIGAWPDNWATWQVALDDALPFHERVTLEDLA